MADENNDKSRTGTFTLVSFLWRLALALALVFITHNPTGYSFAHWVRASMTAHTLGPEHAVAAIALIGGWLIVVSATRSALGSLGLIVLTAFIAALVWWLIDLGWLVTDSAGAIEWIVLACIALLLAVGMSWSHIWRRITGQVTVERVHH